MNEQWTELVTTAVLGTERRAAELPSAPGALGGLLGALDRSDREGALLSAAAALALARQAGRLPVAPPGSAGAPSPGDDLPACPPRAVQHLVALLGGGAQRALLPEWLAALARLGRRVPAAQLPELLELGRAQAELRPAILPTLGRRGVWLASQNPDWAYAAVPQSGPGAAPDPDTLREAWETGTRAARVALLLDIRTTAPALARDLISSTWSAEKADDRTAFIATLEHGLSMADEPLLEGLLDDRSKEVRRTVAGLLVRLPESRLVRRMIARAEPLLSWAPAERPRLLGRATPARLSVAPPAEADAGMARDGIEPQPPAHRQKLGAKAWLLLQILGAVPPWHWSERWQVAPAELLQAAAQSEWKAALIEGWRAATLASGDAEWAEALLADDLSAADLLEALPPARQEALLLCILRGDVTPLHKHPVLDLLRKTRHQWSPDLTRAVLRAVHRHMRKWKDTYDYQLRGALTDEFARRMPPALLAEVAGGWPDEPDVRERWQGVIDKLLITLQFRHDMLAALER
jgi:hypothetical protein